MQIAAHRSTEHSARAAGSPGGNGGRSGSGASGGPDRCLRDDRNVAGLLCYLLGFATGMPFLVIAPYHQNKFVRFHAFQSIFLSVGWVGVVIVEQMINVVLINVSFGLFGIIAMLWMLVGIGFLVLWIVLMERATTDSAGICR